VRVDVAPDELAMFYRHSLTAARQFAEEDAVRRLVAVLLDGIGFRRGPSAGTELVAGGNAVDS
jgi:hypothetical protein